MAAIDTRHKSRDSLFLLAELKVGGSAASERVKVRNLSPGGMMAEGGPKVQRGAQVAVNLRNIGWVEGTVAWVQDARFGIAFVEDIDPQEALAPERGGAATDYEPPRFVKPASILPPGAEISRRRLRKL